MHNNDNLLFIETMIYTLFILTLNDNLLNITNFIILLLIIFFKNIFLFLLTPYNIIINKIYIL